MASYIVECKVWGKCGTYVNMAQARNKQATLDFHNHECSPHTIREIPQPKGDGEQMKVFCIRHERIEEDEAGTTVIDGVSYVNVDCGERE